MPDISKEINTISKKEMLDFYKKQGLEEETKEILVGIKMVGTNKINQPKTYKS